MRRPETDRAESVRDGDRRPAKRAGEGARRLLDHKLGVHLDELATRSGEFARVVDADDHDMATLAKRPESRYRTDILDLTHARYTLRPPTASSSGLTVIESLAFDDLATPLV